MPFYEYRCSSCGHQQEFLQKVNDPPQRDCPACGKASLSKMVTAAGFQLKGSGWYATDFKGSGSKPASTATGGKAPESKSGEAKPAEAKSEAKPEAKTGSAGPASGTGG